MRSPGTKTVALCGVIVGLVGVLVTVLPGVSKMEAEVGLYSLFHLRGPRPAPEEVVVVAIDRESSRRLGQSDKPRKWDRRLHAKLVRNLATAGARVVAFDVFFEEKREPDVGQDIEFAEALRETGNVILYADLRSSRVSASRNPDVRVDAEVQTLVPPIDGLVEGAAGIAPFSLPKVAAGVHQFWLFKDGAGDLPTLPTVAFQQYSLPHYELFRSLVREALPSGTAHLPAYAEMPALPASSLTREILQTFRANPQLHAQLMERTTSPGTDLDAAARTAVQALIRTYGGESSRYLNFYGPAQSIRSIPYYKVIESPASNLNLSGRAVFVGASELEPAQRDDFYTVFRTRSIDLSGVEIAATAFANLLDASHLYPLRWGTHLLFLFLWGMATIALLSTLRTLFLFGAAIAIPAAAAGSAHYAFVAYNLWLPLAVPVLVQFPLALILALSLRYARARDERERIRTALRRLLPEDAVASLTSGFDYVVEGRSLQGVCLATDAHQYTKVSENMQPEALRQLLNNYYVNLFSPVENNAGFVSDVVGDAMMAIWTPGKGVAADADIRAKACRAAVAIKENVEAFNRTNPSARFPTRIGLFSGSFSLGNVGAGAHYEYRAVGDTVNTASRIEQLNKVLETSILASGAVISDLGGIATREIGAFVLEGKANSIVIHEIVCAGSSLDAQTALKLEAFSAALEMFRSGQWAASKEAFGELDTRFEGDGPSRFYGGLCQRYLADAVPVQSARVIDLNLPYNSHIFQAADP